MWKTPHKTNVTTKDTNAQLTEMHWEEFLVRCSTRPRLSMSSPSTSKSATVVENGCQTTKNNTNGRRKHQLSPGSRHPSPRIGMSLEEPSASEMALLLKELNEKEKDLELAAKLGNSLLEQNKELQEKNDFLEESLSTSNETITQLQRQLKQRSKLFHKLVDLETEQDEVGNGWTDTKPEDVSRLERQVKNLEGENKELRVKTRHLEEMRAIAERREEQKISDFISQLRSANLKIAQLQVQLGEKSQQCEAQGIEVHRLVKEIAERKKREKIIWDEREDIQARLQEAITNHGQLRSEMEQLQERHLDLIAMLRETEDELRMHREKAQQILPPRRTNSTDSLYDSLASELEGADSGCYNTPMFSARYGPSPHWSSLSAGDQPGCSKSIAAPDQISENMKPIDEDEHKFGENEEFREGQKGLEDGNGYQNRQQSFDIPSRALLEAVRTTFDDRRKFRRMSPSRQQQPQHLPLQQKMIEMGAEHEDNDELATPIASLCLANRAIEKTFKDSACSPIQFPSSISSTPRGADNSDEEESRKSSKEEGQGAIVGAEEEAKTPTKPTNEDGLSMELPPDDPQQPATPVQYNTRVGRIPSFQPRQIRKEKSAKNEEKEGHNPHARQTINVASSPSAESVDSLEDYNPPKLGIPGRPGTKDLDLSIRRLNLRKEINEKYQNFRASKGLSPTLSNFYTPADQGSLFQFVYQSAFSSKCPTKQLKQLSCAPPTGPIPYSSPFCSRFSYRPIHRPQSGLSTILPPSCASCSSNPFTAGICRVADFLGGYSAQKSPNQPQKLDSPTTAAVEEKSMIKSGSLSSGLDTLDNNRNVAHTFESSPSRIIINNNQPRVSTTSMKTNQIRPNPLPANAHSTTTTKRVTASFSLLDIASMHNRQHSMDLGFGNLLTSPLAGPPPLAQLAIDDQSAMASSPAGIIQRCGQIINNNTINEC